MLPAMCASLLLLGALAAAQAPVPPSETISLSLTEGTWISVDVHRRTIVFDLMGDIWRMSMSGGAAEALTTGGDWDRQPRFSPSGRRLAYVSDHGGRAQVWLMDRSGRHPQPLTALTAGRAADPVWLPSGEAVLVRHLLDDGRSALWHHPVDGSAPTRLTDPDRHFLAGEATVSEQGIWFSVRTTPFAPNGDPVAGLWQIMRMPLDGGAPRPFLAGAGSAARPTVSPDGRRLAFISRDRDQTLLEVLDLATGSRTVVADWLSRDQLEGQAGQGTYPGLAWGEDSRSLVLWAQGKLWSVTLGGYQEPIPFEASGTWPRPAAAPAPLALPDAVTPQALSGLAWGPEGQLAYTALGSLWLRDAEGTTTRLADHVGDVPSWREDGGALAWTTGPGAGASALGVRTLGWRGRDEELPLSGRLLHPSWGDDSRHLAVLRQMDDHDGAPWYEALLLTRRMGRWSLRTVTTLDGYGADDRPPRLHFGDGRLWFAADHPEHGTVFMSVRESGADARIHLRLPGAEEVAASPDLAKLAYRAGGDIFVVDLPHEDVATDVTSLPRMRASGGAGRGLAWLADSSGLSWFEGSTLHVRRFDDADETLLTDLVSPTPRAAGQSLIALTHVRALTMIRTDEIIEDATIVIEGSRIVSVSAGAAPPSGAEVIDCSGMTAIPGLIDVQAHAHADRGATRPASEWRYETALDFGVTTLHDTQSGTMAALPQAERAAAGLIPGPRVLATGTPLHGAGSAEAARLHVARQKAAGAHSVKLHPDASRAEQRWYAAACDAESVRCVAAARDTGHALSLVSDGYHLIEHALPYTPIYGDVLALWSGSRSVAAPTLLSTPDGLQGENYYFQNSNPLDNPRLLLHHPRRALDRESWRRAVLARDWSFQATARDTAALQAAGASVALGTGGHLQGLGVHWELWALAGPGAMSPYAALQTATVSGARALGLDGEVGTIEAGKRADLIVLTADPLEDIRATTQIALVIHDGQLRE